MPASNLGFVPLNKRTNMSILLTTSFRYLTVSIVYWQSMFSVFPVPGVSIRVSWGPSGFPNQFPVSTCTFLVRDLEPWPTGKMGSKEAPRRVLAKEDLPTPEGPSRRITGLGSSSIMVSLLQLQHVGRKIRRAAVRLPAPTILD